MVEGGRVPSGKFNLILKLMILFFSLRLVAILILCNATSNQHSNILHLNLFSHAPSAACKMRLKFLHVLTEEVDTLDSSLTSRNVLIRTPQIYKVGAF